MLVQLRLLAAEGALEEDEFWFGVSAQSRCSCGGNLLNIFEHPNFLVMYQANFGACWIAPSWMSEVQGIHPLDALSNVHREEASRDPMLQSFDLEGIARYIKDQKCQNIVVLCGAGISTSAGTLGEAGGFQQTQRSLIRRDSVLKLDASMGQLFSLQHQVDP